MNSLASSLELIDDLYLKFLQDPNQVDPSWREFFASLDRESIPAATLKEAPQNLRIDHLINVYRNYGHLFAKVNPIATEVQELPWQLSLARLGFTKEDLSKPFPTNHLLIPPTASLQEIVTTLQDIYSGSISVEYRGLQNPELERWLEERIEPTRFKIPLSIDQKKLILSNLNKSELFEVFLHTKYTGQKRFSLEGGETLIPILATLIETLSDFSAEEFVLGMTHRGRLNVLSNILDKSYAQIFSEFEEGYIPLSFEGSGDVKYHKGFSSSITTSKGKKVRVDLAPNPSHLESVCPIVEGEVYAKQVQKKDVDKIKVIPILIHGDAAIAAQGVVYETMQLYKIPGYSTGGTIHIVVNNQIGFTTHPKEGRSTRYCTDLAKTFSAPVFHVNGEDPEGCIIATLLAAEMRQKFHCDVFIDLNCWRKYGHNEADDPAFTQPLEYQIIREKTPVREKYRDLLIQQGVLERQMAEALEVKFKESLQEALTGIKIPKKEPSPPPKPPQHKELFKPVKTGYPKDKLVAIAKKVLEIPQELNVHKKLVRLIQERTEMIEGKRVIDWAVAEMLAYATILADGHPIRLAGQDSGRGTFSHRHAIWVDQQKERGYIPLQQAGEFTVINSPLTENAGLGFEYGFSLAAPETLVIWEAQFGDFANGAQVVIDQYIATGEQKWNQKSGIVMLLPHGYEGQGPEHSSGRIERYLTLCGNFNMQVVNPSYPHQFFHLLRRQVLAPWRTPLIVFTPKALLRHPDCVSRLEDFTHGSFQEVIDDPKPPSEANRLVLCSGHVYYDLLAKRRELKAGPVMVRIEQLYPLNEEALKKVIDKYPNLEIVWVQEEPRNMGGWNFLSFRLEKLLGKKIRYIGRERSASPAAGSYGLHKEQLKKILSEVFE